MHYPCKSSLSTYVTTTTNGRPLERQRLGRSVARRPVTRCPFFLFSLPKFKNDTYKNLGIILTEIRNFIGIYKSINHTYDVLLRDININNYTYFNLNQS